MNKLCIVINSEDTVKLLTRINNISAIKINLDRNIDKDKYAM